MSDLMKSWDDIQREIVVCREHQRFYANALTVGLKHPFLNALLPGLMLIRAVCVFEDALREYLLAKQVSKSKLKNASLHWLIESSSKYKNLTADDGHAVRKKRNEIAHQQMTISWDELERFLLKIEAFLNADNSDQFSRAHRDIKVTKLRLTPPEADHNTTIHIRTKGILFIGDIEEEIVFSYDEKS